MRGVLRSLSWGPTMTFQYLDIFGRPGQRASLRHVPNHGLNGLGQGKVPMPGNSVVSWLEPVKAAEVGRVATDPPKSPPNSRGENPAATAAAPPPVLPPGVQSVL
jgi:hypothetical protein